MAQQCILWDAVVKCGLESINIVQPFSCETAFTEKVLVHIGHCGCVRIDPGVSRKDFDEARTRRTFEGDADSGLQDAVPVRDSINAFVDLRSIQRVCRGADQLPRNVSWDLRVRVECYDIAKGF